jgi:HK97 family phage major capsid protein
VVTEVAPELTEQIGELITRIDELNAQRKVDGANKAEIDANLQAAAERIGKLEEERDAREQDAAFETKVKDTMERLDRLNRRPSKADVIGNARRLASGGGLEDTPLVAIAWRNSTRMRELNDAGKAALDELGMIFEMPDPAAKATVGDTDAAGGYLVPNAVVQDITLQAAPGRQVVDLFTVINGVRGNAVDQPWEQSLDSRAVIAAAGATKENSNFITNNYTATLYTLARIFDVGNQLLRQSGGAAESLVRSKLARAFAAGEDYYALQGSGSSEPYGLLTAIGTSGTYVSTFSSPSSSTIAGSVLAAISTAAGALEDRGATADGVVLNTADWWLMARQGKDEAGFWLGPNEDMTRNEMTLWGLTARKSNRMPSDSLVVGQYKAANFFRGQGYRVDTSDQAGDRWDKNLTGFRGEEEIAFDARPYVYTGYFQRITNAVP